MSWLLKDLKKGASFGKTLAHQALADAPGEQVATFMQDANDWVTLNPQKTLREFMQERPDAAYQTAIASLVGSGGVVSVVKGIEKATGSFAEKTAKAEQAEQGAQALAKLGELATASKVLQRDPETFAQFVAQATENGPVAQVFIDAQTLMQSGVVEQLATLSPTLPCQG